MSYENGVLSRFPKQRPELPQAYRSIYLEHYKRNRDGASAVTSISKKMESWMHRKVAEDVIADAGNQTTLEIGAGTLNHLQYEPQSEKYDIIEPMSELYANSTNRSRIRTAYQSLDDVLHTSYSRIISIAAFEHICELPNVIGRCGQLLSEVGQLRVAIPSEGTILWKLGWTLTTGVEFRLRYGLGYGVLMRHEHVNTAEEIDLVLNAFFKSVHRTVFGISPGLSFYQFFECRNPDLRRCSQYC